MKSCTLVTLFIIILLVVLLYSLNSKGDDEQFTHEDKIRGERALRELAERIKKGFEPPEVSLEEIQNSDVLMIKVPKELEKENMSYFHAENTRYWPYYYYSFPYNYKYGGAWPPGMYSRLYYWSPGFYTGSGWSYYMRPGMGYKNWPRNRWVRHTQAGKNTYYYLTNRGDYTHNAANYSDTPLKFLGD